MVSKSFERGFLLQFVPGHIAGHFEDFALIFCERAEDVLIWQDVACFFRPLLEAVDFLVEDMDCTSLYSQFGIFLGLLNLVLVVEVNA